MDIEQPTERKLATIRQIAEINPIPDADAIEVATIDGWKVVVKKGEFNVGDPVIYFEIDSWIPETVAPFLCKGRTYNDIVGEHLRTVKLRGQVSQGLALPVEQFFTPLDSTMWVYADYRGSYSLAIGDDVTEELGIQKYEKPMSGQLRGVARGNFPSFIRKTDQERIQNLKRDFARWRDEGVVFEVTEKLDGSSMTVYFNNGDFGVCSRNLDLKEDETNTMWVTARMLQLEAILREYGHNIALQGEIIGPGIQGNKYGLSKHEYRVFDIFDIDNQEYVGHDFRKNICEAYDIAMVPLIDVTQLDATIDDVLKAADGQSVVGKKPAREGLVFKSTDGKYSFKAVSNKWLIRYDE